MSTKQYSTCFLSGVTPANQTKERPVHELFPGAFRNKSSICESCLFPKEKHTRIHKKMGEIHMNFSLLALSLVWFAGRLLNTDKYYFGIISALILETAKSTHNPHKIKDQHRECTTGCGACLPFS